MSSSASTLNPVHFGEEGGAYPLTLSLSRRDQVNMGPGNAQLSGHPGEDTLVKEGPPKFRPGRVSIATGNGVTHTVQLYKAGLESCQGKSVASGEKSEWAVRIRRLRDSLQLSQRGFSQLFLGRDGEPLDPQSVSNWERGLNRPSPPNLIKMGNLAPEDDQRLWFWAQGGIDLTLIPRAARHLASNSRQEKRKIS